MTVYEDPYSPEELATLDAHEIQDAAYDAEHAADAAWEAFLAGVRASSGTTGFGVDHPAFKLGEEVGWLLRGAAALDPETAPILDHLTKETP